MTLGYMYVQEKDYNTSGCSLSKGRQIINVQKTTIYKKNTLEVSTGEVHILQQKPYLLGSKKKTKVIGQHLRLEFDFSLSRFPRAVSTALSAGNSSWGVP